MKLTNIKDTKDIIVLDGETMINQYLANGQYGDYLSHVIIERLDYNGLDVDLSELTLDMIRNENLLFYMRKTEQ